jgi:hypothetical protein
LFEKFTHSFEQENNAKNSLNKTNAKGISQ